MAEGIADARLQCLLREIAGGIAHLALVGGQLAVEEKRIFPGE
jgi:hypothetical protein